MARIERDREDLLAEATALVERVELAVVGHVEHVLVGFRSSGCGSVYFGPDEAYQFNTAGQLRRAYQGGSLYRAERSRLVRLKRQRTAAEVALVRHDLSAEETTEFMGRMRHRLDGLTQALTAGNFSVIGQVPNGMDLVAKIRNWLDALPHGAIAASPHVC